MTTFHVLTVDKIKDGVGVRGPFTTWKLGLRNGDGNEPVVAELFCPANAQPPVVGATVDGEIEKTDNPSWLDKFKPTRAGGSYGGRKDFKADPAKQAAIAMESAQKSAVEIMRLAMDSGAWTPSQDDRPVSEMTGVVKTIAAALYAQISEVSEAAK